MSKVVVTGAGRGLGLAICKRLLNEGYGVIAVSRKLSVELERLLANAPGSSFVAYDFSDLGGIQALARTITKQADTVYGLVNNAATSLSGMLATESPAKIEELIKVNLTAPILLTREFMRHMLTKGTGRIINVSSVNALTGYSGLAAYAATKSGLIGFTRSLAREAGKAGITVNAVAPGFLETDMSQSIDQGRREIIRNRSPLKRFATVDEVASAVVYLMSEDAGGITGTTITVDAGNSA